MEDTKVMNAVVESLANLGYAATMEYPGYICIRKGYLTFDFGTMNNDKWEADIEGLREGGYVSTDVPANSSDVQEIVSGIAKAVNSCDADSTGMAIGILNNSLDEIMSRNETSDDAVIATLTHAIEYLSRG